MYRKDQIKGIIALVLFACIGVSYFFNKNGDITMTVSIIAVVIWLVSMFFLNKRDKD